MTVTLGNKTYQVVKGGQFRNPNTGIVRYYTVEQIENNANGIADFILTIPNQQYLQANTASTPTEKPKKS